MKFNRMRDITIQIKPIDFGACRSKTWGVGAVNPFFAFHVTTTERLEVKA